MNDEGSRRQSPPVSPPDDRPTTGLPAAITDDYCCQATDQQLLRAVDELQVLSGQVDAALARVLVETERRGVTQTGQQISTAEYLHRGNRMSRSASRRMVIEAESVAAHSATLRAVEAGTCSWSQALALTDVLGKIDDEPAEVIAQAEQVLLEHANEFDPTYLRRLGVGVLARWCPEADDAANQRALERQEERARRERFLQISPPVDGVVHFRGALPEADAQLVFAAITEVAKSQRTHGVDVQLDPLSRERAPRRAVREADALVEICRAWHSCPEHTGHPSPRPAVTITMTIDQLREGLGALGALPVDAAERGLFDETMHAASELRLLACDAELIPAVLGGDSQVLDLGRQRLFTGALRHALELRDQGCTFPGCDVPASLTEAHHIIPWLLGGLTRLDNGVLLCRHHHRVVEPTGADPDTRWQVRISDFDGLPEFRPPHLPDDRPWWRHARHRLRSIDLPEPDLLPDALLDNLPHDAEGNLTSSPERRQ